VTHHHLRVLIVEDSAENAEALKKFLEAAGHEVFVAGDASSAFALAHDVKFDVLLSDLALPDGDGWRLLQRLSIEGPIRAVAMSGNNTAADVARSLSVGFLDHLAKPISAERLTAALDRAAA
jgi:CheY-like chemotaxis protein